MIGCRYKFVRRVPCCYLLIVRNERPTIWSSQMFLGFRESHLNQLILNYIKSWIQKWEIIPPNLWSKTPGSKIIHLRTSINASWSSRSSTCKSCMISLWFQDGARDDQDQKQRNLDNWSRDANKPEEYSDWVA